MPTCEKCWADAYNRHIIIGEPQSDCYLRLIQLRGNNACTAEQQAGIDAKICPKCKKKTIHQLHNECMNNECK